MTPDGTALETIVDMLRESIRESRESNKEIGSRLIALDGRVTNITEIVSGLSAQLDVNNKKTDALECQVNTIQNFVSASKGGKEAYVFLFSLVGMLTALTALFISL
ncbi:MAG: hypothetical protein PHT13_00085 [Methanosarcina sp.]|nr:hypothetical protein [Methanosarcina sp.]